MNEEFNIGDSLQTLAHYGRQWCFPNYNMITLNRKGTAIQPHGVVQDTSVELVMGTFTST